MMIRRVKAPVSLPEARTRLLAYRAKHGSGPFHASELADAIWPDAEWIAAQGAGAAASRILKKLECSFTSRPWGWSLAGL